MRYVLAAIFVCAVGMPATSALPTVSPNSVSVDAAYDPWKEASAPKTANQFTSILSAAEA